MDCFEGPSFERIPDIQEFLQHYLLEIQVLVEEPTIFLFCNRYFELMGPNCLGSLEPTQGCTWIFSIVSSPHGPPDGFPASILLQVTVAAITNKYNTPTIQPMESLFLPHLRVQQGVSGQHIYGYTIYHLHDNSRIQVDRGSAITGVFQVDPPLSIPFSQPEMKSIWRSICKFLYSRPGSSHCTYMTSESQVGFPEASPEVKICL